MLLIPAIDLKDGKCVRLKQGRMEDDTVFSEDPVAAAKVCANFAKDNEDLVILGGSLDGEVMDQTQVDALAKLPSLDELRAKIVGMISTPATRIAGVLQAPAGQLARVLNAKAEQGEAA